MDIPDNYFEQYVEMIDDFKEWANGRTGQNPENFDDVEKFSCPVIRTNFKHLDNTLVLRIVSTRPCAEGHGFYKVFLYEAVKLARESFDEFMVDSCLPANQSILTKQASLLKTIALNVNQETCSFPKKFYKKSRNNPGT